MNRKQLQGLMTLGGMMLLMIILLTFMSCTDRGGSGGKTAIMPSVVGSSLELAKSDIERAGYEGTVEVIGAGTFGALDGANWEVCTQLPDAGQKIVDTPRLTVERSCGEDTSSESSEPEADDSENPATTDSD